MDHGGVEPPSPRCKRASLPLAYGSLNFVNLKIIKRYALLKFAFMKNNLFVFIFGFSPEEFIDYLFIYPKMFICLVNQINRS